MSEQRHSWLPASELETWEVDLESETIARIPELVQELHAKHEWAVGAMLDPSLVRRARRKLAVSEHVAAEALDLGNEEGVLPSSVGIEHDQDISTYIDYWSRIERSVFERAGSIDGFGIQHTDPGLNLVRLKPRTVNQNQIPPRIEYIDCQVKAGEWRVAAYAHQQSAGGTPIPVVNVPDISATEVAGLLHNASRSYDQLLVAADE